MKIMIVSDWMGKMHAEAFSVAFKNMGMNVINFSWKKYFEKASTNFFCRKILRFQDKFILGHNVRKLNDDLLRTCVREQPDLIFILRGTHVWPRTLMKIKETTNAKIFGYHNDDPFSKSANKFRYRYFIKCLQFYDHIFSYRLKNIADYKNLGFTSTSILRSYYIADRNYPIPEMKGTGSFDVVFVGHFENDGRDELFFNLIKDGIKLRIFGPEWQRSKHYLYFKKEMGDITPAIDNYNEVLNKARVAIVLYSKLNQDTYTRRCFEIPATKTAMLCEFSEDMSQNLFKEGFEALYFRDYMELYKKILFLLSSIDDRNRIANAAYDKLHTSGHEIKDRCNQILDIYEYLDEASIV